MNYRSLIKNCTDYIRKNPSEEITAQNLANRFGYSLYHLSSVFRACCGCSVGRYILEEKLRIAARKIREGKKITDAAFEGGFDSSSGFTRAFRRQFGCSPREYKKQASSLLLPGTDRSGAPTLHTSFPVDPEFVKRTGFQVYGYEIPVDENHEQAGDGAFWSNIDFKSLPSYPKDASDYAEIGAWIHPDPHTGQMNYFFGYVTTDPCPAEGFHQLLLPAGSYAVFRLPYHHPDNPDQAEEPQRELPQRVKLLWRSIFDEWFSTENPSVFDDSRLCFEKYGEESVEIHIPLYS